MNDICNRLKVAGSHIDSDGYTVMIIGLGSVGTYLLDFLVSDADEAMRIVVVGRTREKLEEKVNIVRIAALIREKMRSQIEIADGVDLTDIDAIRRVIERYKPDFIVNSSRAYPGLKYGSISWTNFRAYGIWSPLAIRFTKNIMQAVSDACADAIVINTSYSDAVIPWMKSAGKAYPDFGSGNINHLVPRIRYAVADMLGVRDYWDIDVIFAAGHFHDVVISKEGQTEGVELPLRVFYRGEEIEISGGASSSEPDGDRRSIVKSDIFSRCAITMPSDSQRNMMNASSNYRIISSIVDVLRGADARRLFIPGADGHIGGYPVMVGRHDGDNGHHADTDKKTVDVWIDESMFSLEEMEEANRRSLYLDGIEDVKDGTLYYTDELLEKVYNAFDVKLPKSVSWGEIEDTAEFLIKKIIMKEH